MPAEVRNAEREATTGKVVRAVGIEPTLLSELDFEIDIIRVNADT